MKTTFETGATSAPANNLVLSVLNDGVVYADRLHAGWVMLQGASHRVSFRDLVTNEADKQRKVLGSKFPAKAIKEATGLVQAATITHCLELLRDGYDKTRNIEVIGRQWFDKVNGNTYFSCRILIPCTDVNCRTITVPFEYGYGDHWKDVALQTLRKIGLFADIDLHSVKSTYPVNWTFEGLMQKRYMYGGVYIR